VVGERVYARRGARKRNSSSMRGRAVLRSRNEDNAQ
jgi:hypothetical protein